MKRQRLVVIGNGMAGARAVEEILARGGADQFQTVMFGAEPYGNYNRILLSGVLSGTHAPRDIFINPLGWYQEHDITLHAGVPVERIDRPSKLVVGAGGVTEPYDKLIVATGSDPVVPPARRRSPATRDCLAARRSSAADSSDWKRRAVCSLRASRCTWSTSPPT